MKKILVGLLMVSQLLLPPAFAATVNTGKVKTADSVFDSGFDIGQVEVLSSEEMAYTQGEFLPAYFGYLAAVVTIDLALAGFYWGVYVPTVYSQTLNAYQSYDR